MYVSAIFSKAFSDGKKYIEIENESLNIQLDKLFQMH